MTHACPDCGMSCTCDMEDHESDAPDDCCHECEPESDDVDIGVVGCYHQYVNHSSGCVNNYAECTVCGHRFFISNSPYAVEWSELQDPTTWKPLK